MTEKKDDISEVAPAPVRELDMQPARPLTILEICQRRELALLQARMLLELLAEKQKKN